MVEHSETVDQLESIKGVRNVTVEEIDDGFEFHVTLGAYVNRKTVEKEVSDKTGLYNAGSYTKENNLTVLKYYTP